MSDPRQDVVVIGGGPAGSCAATCLARAGLRVVVLEKEAPRRFRWMSMGWSPTGVQGLPWPNGLKLGMSCVAPENAHRVAQASPGQRLVLA